MNAWRFVLVTAVKDLRRLLRDPLGLAMSIAMPFIITGLMAVIFGGQSPKPHGTLLVVDHDDTFLSSAVRNAFAQGPLAKLITAELVSEEEGKRRVDRGEVSGLVTVPAGFQRAVLKDEPITLPLVTNPAQRILPGIIKEAIQLLSDAQFYAHALVGDQIRKFAERPPTDLEIAQFSVMSRHLGDKLGRYLDPLVMSVETVKTESTAKPASMGVMFFPGMLFFGVILVCQTLSADFWKEKSAGTLRRTLTTSGPRWAFLLGKTLAACAVLAAVGGFGLLCARFLLNQSITMPIAALGWIVISGAVIYLVLVAINLVLSSERGASVLTSLAVFIFAMVGGGFFPFEMMPKWLAAIGRWTPNGWASEVFRTMLGGANQSSGLVGAIAGLTGVGLTMFLLSLWRLRGFALR